MKESDLKPFDIEKVKAGAKCFLKINDELIEVKLVFESHLITDKFRFLFVFIYNDQTYRSCWFDKAGNGCDGQLYINPKIKKIYSNLYKLKSSGSFLGSIYDTDKESLKNTALKDDNDLTYIKTIEIEIDDE